MNERDPKFLGNAWDDKKEEGCDEFKPIYAHMPPFGEALKPVGVSPFEGVKESRERRAWRETVEKVHAEFANKPLNSHYHPTNDPYRFALDNDLGPIEMHIIKYVSRHRKKNGKQDLEKAKLALDRLIKEVYGDA